MKQGSNSRRPRGRSNNNKRSSNRNNNQDIGSPEGRIRGNASQVHEKYLALARDALSADDRISSENYSQHAEHFYRIMTINAENQKSQSNSNQNNEQTRNQKERGKSRRNRSNARGNNRNVDSNDEGVSENKQEKDLTNKEKIVEDPKVIKKVEITAPIETLPKEPTDKKDESQEPSSV